MRTSRSVTRIDVIQIVDADDLLIARRQEVTVVGAKVHTLDNVFVRQRMQLITGDGIPNLKQYNGKIEKKF